MTPQTKHAEGVCVGHVDVHVLLLTWHEMAHPCVTMPTRLTKRSRLMQAEVSLLTRHNCTCNFMVQCSWNPDRLIDRLIGGSIHYRTTDPHRRTQGKQHENSPSPEI